jgi:acyl-CoA dehydrogenase
MDPLHLPLFEDEHRELAERVQRLCDDRISPLAGSELEDAKSACIEYVALLGQEGLFDRAIGKALEGESPRPELRALCLIRTRLARTSGLCDGAFGAHCQGMYPIALSGNEDQRAVFLPGMASGQRLVSLALLDGDQPARVTRVDEETYKLSGCKEMVPLAPIADAFVVLARHDEETPRFSLFVVDNPNVEAQKFVSPMPVGRVLLDDQEVDADNRLGGEGQGLVIAQATLDMLRLPAASACVGLAQQALQKGTAELLRRGIGGRPLREQQGAQWRLAQALCAVEGAQSMVMQTAWRRDKSAAREVRATSMARQLAQDAAEDSALTVADLIGLRGLSAKHPWSRLLAEARALRLEGEFLENPYTVVAQALIASLESGRG